MLHYSLGDSLRSWMRENSGSSFADHIQDRLDNQGFLTAEKLFPFLHAAVVDAIRTQRAGVIVDGFPRCLEQLRSFDEWVTQEKVVIPAGSSHQTMVAARPDLVLLLEITEENARSRYLVRGRDGNDNDTKFDKRFEEYCRETSEVEHEDEQRGILLRVSVEYSPIRHSRTHKGRST